MVVGEEGHVVFKMGTQEQAVTSADARDIQSHLDPERSVEANELHSQIAQALREDGGEVRLSNDAERRVLLLILDKGVETQHPLTDGQNALREALRGPIVLG